MGTSKPKLAPVGAVAVLILLWAGITGSGLVDPLILPSPAKVFAALFQLLTPSELLKDLLHTVGRVTAALTVATLVGVPVGLWLGYQQRIYALIEGPVHGLRSIPPTALFPLFLILVGVRESSLVAMAAYPSLLVILINTISGARLANQRRLQQARVLGLGPWAIATEILFWESLPHILAGVRIAASYGLALCIAAEMFIGISAAGLGRKIFDYQAAYRIPETYAAICLAGAVGIGLNGVVTILEKSLLRWVPLAHEEDAQ